VQFPTTRWDELAIATLHGDIEARRALDEFCRRYWTPVNNFVRWKGYSEAEAADLTQDFFLNFVTTRSWRRADPLQGRFRTFLLGALSHRLAKARAHQQRLKRGGGAEIVSLDDASAAAGEEGALPAVAPAEVAHFDREWAVGVLGAALAATREAYAAQEKQRHYEALKSFLSAQREAPSYEAAAAGLGMSVAAVKSEIHRLRQSLRTALHREIARTVSDPRQVAAELHYLRDVLTHGAQDFRRPDET
jgi:RNA polymerase sigma factor (sigma-70 family)